MVPDIAQSTHGIRNIFADIRNVPTSVPCVSDIQRRMGMVQGQADRVR